MKHDTNLASIHSYMLIILCQAADLQQSVNAAALQGLFSCPTKNCILLCGLQWVCLATNRSMHIANEIAFADFVLASKHSNYMRTEVGWGFPFHAL